MYWNKGSLTKNSVGNVQGKKFGKLNIMLSLT